MKSSQQILCFCLQSSQQLKLLESIQSYWKVKSTKTNSGIFLGTATHWEKNCITFLFYVNNSSKEKSASAQSIKLLVYFFVRWGGYVIIYCFALCCYPGNRLMLYLQSLQLTPVPFTLLCTRYFLVRYVTDIPGSPCSKQSPPFFFSNLMEVNSSFWAPYAHFTNKENNTSPIYITRMIK